MIPYAVYRKFASYLAAVKSPTRVEELITSILEGQAERLRI